MSCDSPTDSSLKKDLSLHLHLSSFGSSHHFIRLSYIGLITFLSPDRIVQFAVPAWFIIESPIDTILPSFH
ncbi:Hypothetical protein NTJ_03931 [Nesidiocoris tenuis]|uniref:Uncharacterized protein n=1 Tax=Nesidiocoris tenuis TaxID=355587 RepID=A0ABN7AFS8_9HEMI|nr:Hypothetical protein NTJ_03931 [Nesidiocoris tenuis]